MLKHIHSADFSALSDSAASLLLGMNDNRSANLATNDNRPTKTSRERSDSPFTFPRQRRSVRPRLYLSINSDSEQRGVGPEITGILQEMN